MCCSLRLTGSVRSRDTQHTHTAFALQQSLNKSVWRSEGNNRESTPASQLCTRDGSTSLACCADTQLQVLQKLLRRNENESCPSRKNSVLSSTVKIEEN